MHGVFARPKIIDTNFVQLLIELGDTKKKIIK
jgi:hypothetical protein